MTNYYNSSARAIAFSHLRKPKYLFLQPIAMKRIRLSGVNRSTITSRKPSYFIDFVIDLVCVLQLHNLTLHYQKLWNVPSWCDRILWKAYPEQRLMVNSYDWVPQLQHSDHRPVFATFVLSVPKPISPLSFSTVRIVLYRYDDLYFKAH